MFVWTIRSRTRTPSSLGKIDVDGYRQNFIGIDLLRSGKIDGHAVAGGLDAVDADGSRGSVPDSVIHDGGTGRLRPTHVESGLLGNEGPPRAKPNRDRCMPPQGIDDTRDSDNRKGPEETPPRTGL